MAVPAKAFLDVAVGQRALREALRARALCEKLPGGLRERGIRLVSMTVAGAAPRRARLVRPIVASRAPRRKSPEDRAIEYRVRGARRGEHAEPSAALTQQAVAIKKVVIDLCTSLLERGDPASFGVAL